MSKSAEWNFGIHSVQALLSSRSKRLKEVIFAKDRRDKRLQKLIDLAKDQHVKIRFLDRQSFDRQLRNAELTEQSHQGVLALCAPVEIGNDEDLDVLLQQDFQQPPLFLVLDGVTDPHNIGACLRTCDAAGVTALIVPRDKSASLTGTAAKVASGAAETIPFIQVTNLARSLRKLQEAGVWLVGTAGEAEQDLFQAKLTGPMALVMGAEGKGMRRLTRETCDELIKIPMVGSVSSLNVSVATGVCLYEIVRQRSHS